MLFNSYQFLLFFPVVTLAYFMIPDRLRWIWLLVCSYFFYMCWNPKYVLLIAISTIISYICGLLLEHTKGNRKEWVNNSQGLCKILVVIGVTANLLMLFFFKYFDFAIVNLNRVLKTLGITLIQPTFDILLPIGISFYIFKSLSYIIDIYRGELKPEHNLWKYALYVSFFPQLLAGPIERPKNFIQQIYQTHSFDFERVKNGLLLMAWGFFQKMVIADRVAELVNQVYNHYTEYSGVEIAIASLLFSVQIYCDFSGYSDIAIGAAQVMGFKTMDNFKRPYFARSVQDFWKRWHISLSTWFRDYVYIPLGGSRCSKVLKYRNIMITFLVSGIWHGASWNYVVWGGIHGTYLVLGDLLRPAREKILSFLKIDIKSFSYTLFQGIVTFLMVSFAWIFFRANGTKTALKMIKQVFTNPRTEMLFNGSLYQMGLNQLEFNIMLISIVILFGISILRSKVSVRMKLSEQPIVVRWVIYYLAIFIIFVFGVYGPEFTASQFIYSQF